MSKRMSKIEVRHSDRAPTVLRDSNRLVITTSSGQGFMIDIHHNALRVRVDGIEFLTVEPDGANMVTLRRRRRS